jgi:hypothetical protein
MMLAFGRRCLFAAALLLVPGLGGCVTFYVDSSITEVPVEQRVKVATPQPVQVLFEFQTKGVANSQATAQIRDIARGAVRESGLFSDVTDIPPPNGALLHITINNVELNDTVNDAAAKGFVTGLTFGLVGSVVGDGYICTLDYVSGPGAPVITTVGRDAIFAAFGTAGPPPNVRKAGGALEAINVIVRRRISIGLNDLAKNSGFPK